MAEHADLIVVNARVLTVDDDNPRAEAVAVKGDRIVAVGDRSAVTDFAGPATRFGLAVLRPADLLTKGGLR